MHFGLYTRDGEDTHTSAAEFCVIFTRRVCFVRPGERETERRGRVLHIPAVVRFIVIAGGFCAARMHIALSGALNYPALPKRTRAC